MKRFGLRTYALSGGVAAALLAGCGGSQLPLGSSVADEVAAPTRDATHDYRVIYSFKGGRKADGSGPGALTAMNGTLYGATVYGGGLGCISRGVIGCGTVFQVSTSGEESVIYRFVGPPNAEFPIGTPINLNGDWYGSSYGGAYSSGTRDLGNGAVYRLDASGQEQVIYSFKGGSNDGAGPVGDLVALNGILYGTTTAGGFGYGSSHSGYGTVFKLTPSGSESLLHKFTGQNDGAYPWAGLIAYKGNLYGTTQLGGKENFGTVFSITTSGKERVLYSFKGYRAGGKPEGPLTAVDGNLYGTAAGSGNSHRIFWGTIFKLGLSGKETILHRFHNDGRDGTFPSSRLLNFNGELYGTTGTGGAHDAGIVFSLTYAGEERIVHTFSARHDGGGPNGVIAIKNMLYGSTGGGGTARCYEYAGKWYPCGTVFRLNP
jgi:uncharacterized repeat protein (TIGR03803 family)